MKVDFATFCHKGDAHRLHAPGQLMTQVESNQFEFNTIWVIYQETSSWEYSHYEFNDRSKAKIHSFSFYDIHDIDTELEICGIDIDKPQYTSQTDKTHYWKHHVVNHLVAARESKSDYIVFADNDCWMVDQPGGKSWIDEGIKLLQDNSSIFIVSPNDGERARYTSRFSQQMFLARTNQFKSADFNQPDWDGNTNIPNGPMPEYWGMLEGRMELHCRVTGQYRYVLGAEYRYWHHNRLNEQGLFETDRSKY